MGSFFPLQYHNFSGAGASSSKPPVFPRPKIESKIETYDELWPQPSFFAETQDWGLDLTPSAPSIPRSPQTPLPDLVDSDLAEALALLPASWPQDGDVYGEFGRVSEMVRLELDKRSNMSQETGAIVAVPTESADRNSVVRSYKRQKRSNDLVRVTDLSQEDYIFYRNLVRRTRMLFYSVRMFHMIGEEKRIEIGGGKKSRSDSRASSLMRQNGLWLNRGMRIVGAIPGIFVGDLFLFRLELCVVGLHGQIQAGIDYLHWTDSPTGEPIATSIICSNGYEDDEDQGNMLVYSGHGGRDKNGKPYCDQKLEGGNLALEKSMVHGIEIRVIRGLNNNKPNRVYVYDGLYKIVESWFHIGNSGLGVYKFRLMRIENQPQMGSTNWIIAKSLRVNPLELRPKGYITLDLSHKKENMPIFLFNDIDNECDRIRYEYLLRTVFPRYLQANIAGCNCNCITGCTDGCSCWKKNGGEMPYDQFGFLLRGKSVIFECGPHCSCPPSCRNRVSQNPLRHRLEVFRSSETGWGVRTLDLIHAGCFICEYTGVVLTREKTEICSMCGEDNLIYPGRFAARWKEINRDISKVFTEYVEQTEPSLPPLEFAMNLSTLRNVACYMTHSICPNVMVQFVLYDHSNIMFPHVMLFAMENIAPMQELSIDYGVPHEYTAKVEDGQSSNIL